MITFPNCKINLGLFITHKRPDGYHHLQSLFLPGPLTDVLEIIPRKDHECTVQQYNASFNIPIEQHSCYKAWKLLHENFGISGVDIYLLKKYPVALDLVEDHRMPPLLLKRSMSYSPYALMNPNY